MFPPVYALRPDRTVRAEITAEMLVQGRARVNEIFTLGEYPTGRWPTVYAVSIRNGFFPLIVHCYGDTASGMVPEAVELMRFVADNFVSYETSYPSDATAITAFKIRPTPRTRLAMLAVLLQEIRDHLGTNAFDAAMAEACSANPANAMSWILVRIDCVRSVHINCNYRIDGL